MHHIGMVKNERVRADRFDAAEAMSRIVVAPRYARALDGIEAFSHLAIIFWLDRVRHSERSVMKVHPRKDSLLPLTGVFATRSPARPNPLGLTTVRLLKREGNVLTVKALDAIDGTPVLDIKPFVPDDIAASDITLPEWLKDRHPRLT
jgi:tRNA-Thr(GGU) m(6)t(6)A37 methyltransferase TsaA